MKSRKGNVFEKLARLKKFEIVIGRQGKKFGRRLGDRGVDMLCRKRLKIGVEIWRILNGQGGC
jgi:hypothetical protein